MQLKEEDSNVHIDNAHCNSGRNDNYNYAYIMKVMLLEHWFNDIFGSTSIKSHIENDDATTNAHTKTE